MKNRFFVKVNTQFDNLGDALINRELIRLCSQNGDVVVCTSKVPRHFIGWLSLNAISNVREVRSSFGFLLEIFWACICSLLGCFRLVYVLNPGGYIGEIGFKSYVARFFKAFVLCFLKVFRAKSLLVGASYESLGRWNLKSIRLLAKVISIHAVRDDLTRNYCHENKIRVTAVLPDLAFNLPEPDGSMVLAKKEEGSRHCVCSFRDANDNGFEASVARFLVEGLSCGRLGPITLSYQVGRDVNVMERYSKILRDSGGGGDFFVKPLMNSVEENVGFYANSDYVFSNRLHVLLLALRAGATPVALIKNGGNRKIRGLFSDLGLEDFCIDMDESKDFDSVFHNLLVKADVRKKAVADYSLICDRLRSDFSSMVRV